jgi:hypothetical protein
MISMCGNCSAKVVSVMEGQRPQIRCEGRWRAPYMARRYGSAVGVDSGMCQSGRNERCMGPVVVRGNKGGGTGVDLIWIGKLVVEVLGRRFRLTPSTSV